MKKDREKSKLPNMDMNNNPIWDVLDGKIEPRKIEKKKKVKKRKLSSIDDHIDYYFAELEKEKQDKKEVVIKKNTKKYFSVYSLIILLVLVVIISFTVMMIWKYDQVKVNSDSMAQQITTGDRVLYQPDLDIHRFNVVVHEKNSNLELLRVIGMPGDKVSLKDDVLMINDAIYDEDYLKENYIDFKLQEKNNKKFYTESFTTADLNNVSEESIHVPENKYILLGDNRLDSKDSRELGFYDKGDIQGVAIMKIWPLIEIEPIK